MTGAELLLSLERLVPELILCIGTLALVLVGSYTRSEANASRFVTLGVAALFALALAAAVGAPAEQGAFAFNGAFAFDPFAQYAKAAIFLAAIAALVLANRFLQNEGLARFEYPLLMALAVLGMSIMVSANDLLTLYMGLELQSLALYVLAAFNRDSLRASEAGLKYFVLGALSSGLLLYGSSLVYGFAGSTNFTDIAAAAGAERNIGLIVGMVFVISGLAFKISAAPFHMWTPDVYEGAPTPVAAVFATAPKLAAMALLARVLTEPFGPMVEDWRQVVVVISVLSMAIGAFGALQQTNIKRLMAYSSIGNMGYALVGLAAGTTTGLWSVLVFMTLYVIGVMGAFAVILSMRRAEGMVEQIDDLAGLAQTRPGMAWTMTAVLFSIGGIPFMVGFFGKLFVFYAALEAGLIWFVVAAALFSVISAAYYLRVVGVIWFKESEAEFLPAPAGVMLISRVAGLATVGLLPFVAALFARAIQAGGGAGV